MSGLLLLMILSACCLPLSHEVWTTADATLELPLLFLVEEESATDLFGCMGTRCLELSSEARAGAWETSLMLYAELESTYMAGFGECPPAAGPLQEGTVAGHPAVHRVWVRCTEDGRNQAVSYTLIQTPTHYYKMFVNIVDSDAEDVVTTREAYLDGLQIGPASGETQPRRIAAGKTDLRTARKGHETPRTRELDPRLYDRIEAPEPPDESGLERVHYPGPLGPMVAYQTPDPGDGGQHPVVIWAHGGGGGVDSWFWEPAPAKNDQSAKAFRDAGIAMVIPSWRGENKNPGDPEGFLGEVDDLLAARAYAAALPWTDPKRVYLAGHSTGGTVVLLAAELGGDFRAAFSFGGNPWIDESYQRFLPFEADDEAALHLRRAIPWVGDIEAPTFWIEAMSIGPGPALEMQRLAGELGAPFAALPIARANHFDLLTPLTKHLAGRIVGDTGPALQAPFTLTAAELQGAHDTYWKVSETQPYGP